MEGKNDLIFIGYRSFKGKQDTTKTFYVLSFITSPIVSDTKASAFCKNIDIFVNKDVYNNFISSNGLLDSVEVPYEVVGDKVQYKLQ